MNRLGFALLIMMSLFIGLMSVDLTTSQPTPLPTPSYIRAERLGVAHISAPEGGTSSARYQQALALGAQWNRYPIYWDRIETEPGVYDWERFDIQIADDLRYGFSINAILLGRPAFRADESRIQGMDAPIFADGSDLPAEGKAINPENYWAGFVYEAVNRYKPGGVLAEQGLFPEGQGVRVWEVWNEPDYTNFWSGTIRDYARLLKVAYLAAHHADPETQVMFGGLLFGTPDNWLARVLAIYINDPFREQFNWYMDIVALHSYASPWRTGWLVRWVKQTLIAYNLDRPIWVNETGVPVWDDYPGPTWATEAEDRPLRQKRATQEQQARFFIQSAVYAWAEGAEVIIFHQLYDDCGDQAPGTNFPPHDGRLCREGEACWGDAHGMFRNLSSSVCFAQHPEPGTPRRSALAYRLLAQVFHEPFARGKYLQITPDAVVIEFRRLNRDQRVVVMWSQKLNPVALNLPAEGRNAQLINLDSSIVITPDENGVYTLLLAAAEPDDHPEPPFGADTAIGGAPYILIEGRDTEITPLAIDLNISALVYEPPAPIIVPTPGAIQIPLRPTDNPLSDQRPPVARLDPLPEVSPSNFTVTWGGEDNSGIAYYIVWVRENGGAWRAWMETDQTSATFTGTSGSRYEFDIWAQDLAGNWSQNVQLSPQVATVIE